jgi:hypothetical protein
MRLASPSATFGKASRKSSVTHLGIPVSFRVASFAMTSKANIQQELDQRHRSATLIVLCFFVLDLVLLAIAYFAVDRIFRPSDPKIAMGLWIAILVCGLGVFVLRRTRFSAMRLKDIAAVNGTSALIKSLQGTTIEVASIGGAIALMGFIITIIKGDWTDMLRAAGVSVIVLIYCYPFKSAWQRTVNQLAPPPE